MSRDYFLIHRAVQIQLLCGQDANNPLEVPGRFARDGFSKSMLACLRCIDRICKLPFAKSASGGVMQVLLSLGSDKRPAQLTPKQRELIYEFETRLVEVQLSDDPFGQKWAAATISTILKNRAFFYGPKPLAEHSEEFAYEFLYPTWLNLYTVMRTRDSSSSQPKFSDVETSEIFSRLDLLQSNSHAANLSLIAIVTFVANRFTPAESVEIVKQLVGLDHALGRDGFHQMITSLTTIQERSSSASAFRALLKNYLLVKRQILGLKNQQARSGKPGPFPPRLAERLLGLEQHSDQFSTYEQLLLTTGKIVESAGGFSRGFGNLFQSDEYKITELLDLCLSADEGHPAFSRRIQELIVQVIEWEKKAERYDLRHVRRFAHRLGRRLDALDDDSLETFTDEFIRNDKQRWTLLTSAPDDQKRGKIAQRLLDAAVSESNVDRFFYLLLAAALIDTQQDYQALCLVRRTIKVFRLVRQDESMSRGELADLLADVRHNLPESLGYLQKPGLAGRGKPDRLARMYLALNEACEQYAACGRTGNFGLVRAAYRNLNRLSQEE